ncbi:MAG: hypothetical protein M4D80_21355 [Myxococcota bacterium]|nr:hypothetical protein [Myxococcota bacterium]
MLAFVRTWAIDDVDVARMRRRLATLDSELVVVCDEGAWSFDRDRQPLRCEVDVETARELYDVTDDAVFVIDRSFVRFAHRPEGALGATLLEALDAATEALGWRGHQTKLELVRWTAREWALKCLVVGCSLTFVEAPPPVEYRRFPRGTERVVKYESRDTTTPRADGEAPTSRMPAIGQEPITLSTRRQA